MPSTNNPQDHYTTLSLPRTATSANIKRAFRRLAILHHPDKLKLKQPSPNTSTSTSTHTNPTTTDTDTAAPFRTIRTAYETLIDPASRRRYDAFLASHQNSSMFVEEEEEEEKNAEWDLFCADWEEAREWARRFEEELERGVKEGEGEGKKGNVERCFGVEELRAWKIGKGKE